MNILIGICGGFMIGIFFYGGLWLTVRKLAVSRHPVVLTMASFWGRTLFSLIAFMLLIGSDWSKALSALIGFTIARVATPLALPKGGPRCT